MTYIMAENQSQLNIRLPKWLFLELQQKENFSAYIRDLIIKDRLNKADPKFIDKEIEKREREIARLEKLLHSK